MLDDPARVDAHVVRHHVAGQADAARAARSRQILVRRLAAEIVRDVVVVKRVGGRHGVGVAAQQLDPLRGRAALPDADQPESGEAPAGQLLQFFVGDLVQPVDVAPVLLGELIHPDVDVLRHHHHAGHPVDVGTEGFVLGLAATADAEAQEHTGLESPQE